MSFQVARWPLPDDVERYRRDLNVPADAIVRDIARLVTVAQMVHDGELNDDLVLTGGMAMRLRGSPRFTMSDTDTSRRLCEAPDRERLAEALTVDQAELTVTPGDVLGERVVDCLTVVLGHPHEESRFVEKAGALDELVRHSCDTIGDTTDDKGESNWRGWRRSSSRQARSSS